MWIGALCLRVTTKAQPHSGTDYVVTAEMLRDGEVVQRFKLDYGAMDDMEPGATMDYCFAGAEGLPRKHDRTPRFKRGHREVEAPGHGIEFSKGLNGHLAFRFKVQGPDVWLKDVIQLFIRELHPVRSESGVQWVEDKAWNHVATWGRDVPVGAEGSRLLTLKLR
jgi:hypothetical protein